MIRYVLYLSLILFPFQTFDLKIQNTAFDISSILISLSILIFFFFSKKKYNIYILIISVFLIFQFIIFLSSPAPTSRFLSALYWITIFILMFYIGNDLKLNYANCEKIIITTLLFSSLICWYEYFFVITPEKYNLGIKFRSDAFFREPSYAGLVFYAASLASILKFFYDEKKIKYLLLFIVFFSTGILTLSMHIVTFFLTLITIYIFIIFEFDLNFIKKFFMMGFFLLVFCCLIYFVIYFVDKNFLGKITNHFLSRLDFFNIETKSLSLLSWLRGFEQMLYSIKKTYIFGYGLGSTGEFYFPSIYGEKLSDYGVFNLTLKDAFSLFFRLVIELGLLFTLLILYQVFVITKNVLREIINDKKKFNETIFVFTFAITIFAGSLLKEPNYARSSLFIAMLIIASFVKKGKYFE